MKTNDLLLIAGVGILGVAAYSYLSVPRNPYAGAGAQYIPPGGMYGGYLNPNTTPVWVTATGVIMNGAGQILNSIPWDTFVNQTGSTSQSDFATWMNEQDGGW